MSMMVLSGARVSGSGGVTKLRPGAPNALMIGIRLSTGASAIAASLARLVGRRTSRPPGALTLRERAEPDRGQALLLAGEFREHPIGVIRQRPVDAADVVLAGAGGSRGAPRRRRDAPEEAPQQ